MARGRHDIGSLRREEDTAMIRLRGIIPAIAAEALLTVLLDRLVGTPVAWALLIALPMALVLLLLLSTPAGVEPSWSAPPTPPSAAAHLEASTLASRLAATAAEARAALGSAERGVMTAGAALGILRIALGAGEPAALAAAIARLRAFVAPDGGSVVVERGPAALRTRVDPWGPVPPPALALMRALKQEFDPRRTLNPGRFVAGI